MKRTKKIEWNLQSDVFLSYKQNSLGVQNLNALCLSPVEISPVLNRKVIIKIIYATRKLTTYSWNRLLQATTTITKTKA